jgi:hypothetical protein
MYEEKYQEVLSLLKQSGSNLKKDKELSKQIDLCSKLYNKVKEENNNNNKYYENRFIEEANKLISYINGDTLAFQSSIKSINELFEL